MATKKESTRKSILSMLNEIRNNSPYTVRSNDIVSNHKLSKIYMHKAISLGIVRNIGGMSKPAYVCDNIPTESDAVAIEDAVSTQWRNSSREKRARLRTQNPTQNQTERVVANVPKNYPDMLEKAMKRKSYLEAELDKVNKVIEAINTVNSLMDDIAF
jgi:hypothetical protein